MEFIEIKENLEKLKSFLNQKKEAIIKKEVETLNKIDEEILVIVEYLNKNDYKKLIENFETKEKEELKAISLEIKKLEEANQNLIKHSLDVINGLLFGILNITNNENSSYNSEGKNLTDESQYTISSITEEA